jgi:hypothetical protein
MGLWDRYLGEWLSVWGRDTLVEQGGARDGEMYSVSGVRGHGRRIDVLDWVLLFAFRSESGVQQSQLWARRDTHGVSCSGHHGARTSNHQYCVLVDWDNR